VPPEKLAEVRSDAKESIWYAGIRGRVEANPMKTLAELNTGKYDGNLSQRHIVALRGEAQQRLDAMAREQEARRKEGLRIIGKQVDDYKNAASLGYQWAGNAPQLARAVRGTEHEAEFNFAQQAATTTQLFAQSPATEREQFLNNMRNRPQTGDSAKLLNHLENADKGVTRQ
jgi:hypothetical protein